MWHVTGRGDFAPCLDSSLKVTCTVLPASKRDTHIALWLFTSIKVRTKFDIKSLETKPSSFLIGRACPQSGLISRLHVSTRKSLAHSGGRSPTRRRPEVIQTAKALQPERPKSLLQWDGNTAVRSWLRPNGLRSQPNAVCRDGFAKAGDEGCAGRRTAAGEVEKAMYRASLVTAGNTYPAATP